MSNIEKNTALAKISNDSLFRPIGRSKFQIDRLVVHVRYCSTNARALGKYKFNINPNTLSADYELWICGGATTHYLMPRAFMEAIYNHPNAYVDRMHPEIRVVSVDSDAHVVTYAAGGEACSLKPYLRATL